MHGEHTLGATNDALLGREAPQFVRCSLWHAMFQDAVVIHLKNTNKENFNFTKFL